MTNNIVLPPEESMLATIMFACVVKVGNSPDVTELRLSLEERGLLVSDVHEYALAYAEKMFALAWALRGNPDQLATLPEPN
jgi:hypothetical protein